MIACVALFLAGVSMLINVVTVLAMRRLQKAGGRPYIHQYSLVAAGLMIPERLEIYC